MSLGLRLNHVLYNRSYHYSFQHREQRISACSNLCRTCKISKESDVSTNPMCLVIQSNATIMLTLMNKISPLIITILLMSGCAANHAPATTPAPTDAASVMSPTTATQISESDITVPITQKEASLQSRTFDPAQDTGGNIFGIQFAIPAGWDVEYIPSIKALNLYTLAGEGSARERSQILMRYFDAKDFLTLSTVTIYEQTDLKIGTQNYTARRYDIQKKSGIAPFADQPAWRNQRHIVTDFRGKTGQTRYYVIAANPTLDQNTYEALLASMTIVITSK